MKQDRNQNQSLEEREREIIAARDYEVRSLHRISLFLLMLLVALVVCAVLLILPLRQEVMNQTKEQNTVGSVYDSVLRFHVRANSDSEEDQNVKMKVKEAVLNASKAYLTEESSKEACIKAIDEHEEEFVEIAKDTLKKEGYTYGVKAYFTREEFPIKRYGDLTFPAGIYDAFRIDLGEAKGHNWWCMLYPSLCFVDATYGVVPEDSKEELKGMLTAEDYEELVQDEDTKVEIHSAIWDTVTKWFQ